MKHLHNRVSRDLLLDRLSKDETPRTTFSFYRYAHILNPPFFRNHLYTVLARHGVLGRIYVSQEGLNGQVSVITENLEACKKELYDITFLEGCRLNIAIEDNGKSFFKLTIKVKEKIVADGLEDNTFDTTDKGKHIQAEEFNDLAAKDGTVIVDMRNHYESEVGHFENAICPDVETFRESLPIVEDILEPHKEENILLYCTGGIRCEKASAYFKHKGYKNVHQLEGGIIEYARQCNEKGLENKFIGKNFVFDERLGEKISDDVIAKCHQCGAPCDAHKNCHNDHCHILFIQCESCAAEYNSTCSKKCKEYMELPEEDQEKYKNAITFNGTENGKGRYNGLNKDEGLVLPQEV